MNRKLILSGLALTMILLLSGCALRTVDAMYCPPKRTPDYQNLQSAIDKAMQGLEYSSPRSGENQQTVQTADLNGDGVEEYLLFARGNDEKPLHILVYSRSGDEYQLSADLASRGTAFEQVEYVQMDDKPGLELVVSRQVSDQVLRSLSVYSFDGTQAQRTLSVSCSKFVVSDLNEDGKTDLMVLSPGATDLDNAVAWLYAVKDGAMERSAEVSLSMPVDHIKRIMVGQLHGGVSAVYVASALDQQAIITDVFAMRDGQFTNVSLSGDSGTSVQTLRNYYVYADDLDGDGILELPSLIEMHSFGARHNSREQGLIRWFNMTLDGSEVDRFYSYHNLEERWYLLLDPDWAQRISVSREGSAYHFYIWDEEFQDCEAVFSIHRLTGLNRDQQAVEDNRFVLFKSDGVVYAGKLEAPSVAYGISQESLSNCFFPIVVDWKTGET